MNLWFVFLVLGCVWNVVVAIEEMVRLLSVVVSMVEGSLWVPDDVVSTATSSVRDDTLLSCASNAEMAPKSLCTARCACLLASRSSISWSMCFLAPGVCMMQ